MDALGAATSIIAVAGAAQTAGKHTIKLLKQIKNAPKEIEQLMHEISILTKLFHQIDTIVKDRRSLGSASEFTEPEKLLQELLTDAEKELQRLNALITTKLTSDKAESRFDRLAWSRCKKDVTDTMSDVAKIRDHVGLSLSSLILADTQRIRIQSAQSTKLPPANFMIGCRRSQEAFDVDCLTIHDGHSENAVERTRDSTNANMIEAERQSQSTSYASHSLYPPVSLSRKGNCHCHQIVTRKYIPTAFQTWIGKLLIKFRRLRVLSPDCSVCHCANRGMSLFSIHYYFPFWMSQKLITARVSGSPLHHPELLLRVVRRVTTLHNSWLTSTNYEEIFQFYSSGEASIHDVDRHGSNVLWYAAKLGNTELLEFLLQIGADPWQPREEGDCVAYYLLLWSIVPQDRLQNFFFAPNTTHGFSRLIEHVAKTPGSSSPWGDADDLGITRLHRLIIMNHHSALHDELRQHPYSIDTIDSAGYSPLSTAIRMEHLNCVENLLEHGTNPAITGIDKWTSVHEAAGCGPVYLEALLTSAVRSQKSVDPKPYQEVSDLVHARNIHGWTPLHEAVLVDRDENVRLLLNHGADVSMKTPSGYSVLHILAFNVSKKTAHALLTSPHSGSLDASARDLVYGHDALDVLCMRRKYFKNYATDDDFKTIERLIKHVFRLNHRLRESESRDISLKLSNLPGHFVTDEPTVEEDGDEQEISEEHNLDGANESGGNLGPNFDEPLHSSSWEGNYGIQREIEGDDSETDDKLSETSSVSSPHRSNAGQSGYMDSRGNFRCFEYDSLVLYADSLGNYWAQVLELN